MKRAGELRIAVGNCHISVGALSGIEPIMGLLYTNSASRIEWAKNETELGRIYLHSLYISVCYYERVEIEQIKNRGRKILETVSCPCHVTSVGRFVELSRCLYWFQFSVLVLVCCYV